MTKQTPKPSKSKQAYDAIIEHLYAGILFPGDIINRQQIAKELKMSVAPVLEAMVQLDVEGILETIPGKGSKVRVLRPEDLYGVCVVRLALECEAVLRLRRREKSLDRSHLETLAKQADAGETGSREKKEAELAFHLAIVEEARCPFLLEQYRRILRQILLFGPPLLNARQATVKEASHREYLRQIFALPAARADDAPREHLRDTDKLLEKIAANRFAKGVTE